MKISLDPKSGKLSLDDRTVDVTTGYGEAAARTVFGLAMLLTCLVPYVPAAAAGVLAGQKVLKHKVHGHEHHRHPLARVFGFGMLVFIVAVGFLAPGSSGAIAFSFMGGFALVLRGLAQALGLALRGVVGRVRGAVRPA